MPGAGGLQGERHDDEVCPDARTHCCFWRPPRVCAVAVAGRGRHQQTGESQSYRLQDNGTYDWIDQITRQTTSTFPVCKSESNLCCLSFPCGPRRPELSYYLGIRLSGRQSYSSCCVSVYLRLSLHVTPDCLTRDYVWPLSHSIEPTGRQPCHDHRLNRVCPGLPVLLFVCDYLFFKST